MGNRWWTEEDEQTVSFYLTSRPTRWIAARLGRTPRAVQHYAYDHGHTVTGQDLLTTGQAAALLGVTRAAVLKAITRGRLRARRVPGGRKFLIDPDDLPVRARGRIWLAYRHRHKETP